MNLRKHGIAFEDACCVLQDPFHILLEDDRDYGEERWQIIGRFEARILVVVFTERYEQARIISARRAKRGEEDLYFGQFS